MTEALELMYNSALLGKVKYLVFSNLILLLTKLFFGEETWALGYNSKHF